MAFENFNPGELNKKIEIVSLAQSGAKDDDGFDTDETVESTVRACWAKVTDETGTKALESGTEFSVARRRFFIRYTPQEITTDMLIRYAGKMYSIVRPPATYGDSGRFIEIWTERKERT